jgi:hypothetical protein
MVSRAFGLVLTVVAVATAGCASRAMRTAQALPSACVSYEPGLRGEVMHTAEGKPLYYNGQCWTSQPMPPLDTPVRTVIR